MRQPDWQTEDGAIRLYCGDCLSLRDQLPKDAAIVSDPPYGIGYDASESSQQGIKAFRMIDGDGEQFDPSPWLDFSDCLLWGVNNYCQSIPSRQGQWYFWDKVIRNGMGVRIAEGEFAWHKCGTKPRAFRHLWSGAYRASENGDETLHPNQKPVALLAWCLELVTGRVIVDPYFGSGTMAIACIRADRQFIGCEIDAAHFATAVARIESELRRTALFEPAPKIVQRQFEAVA